MSVIRESSNFTINNSVLNNIQGNATIIRFGDGTLTKSEVEDFMKGVVTLPDISSKMEQHILIQSITNLPRAKVAYNDYHSQKKNGLCLKGTRENLLGELGSWVVDQEKPQIHVLSGLAGIGKSTIAYTFASKAEKLGILGASFFFSRDKSDSKTAEKFFTTIAFQLCVYDKDFAQAIGDALLRERGSAAITKDLNEQLETLILKPLRDLVKSCTKSIVIVIDALDECDDRDALTVLASLEYLVHDLPCFKVLLTTRPQPHLDHRLSSHCVFYLQNIEDKVINDDIRLYLKSSLSRENVANHLPGLISEWSIGDEEIECLVIAAGKLFIIASTVVRIILDTAVRNPASQMKLLIADGQIRFNNLESFYAGILRRALPEKCPIIIMERFKTVIGAILFVQEPLPLTALQHFTLPYALDDVDAVLKNLESVITVEHKTPCIFHKSFSDFLIQTCHGELDIGIVSEDQHRRLAIFCFKILNKQLKRNILDLKGPACFIDNIAALERQGISNDQFREKIPLELAYACSHWAVHLEGASITNFDGGHPGLVQELSTFVNEHLLHWVESMSWIEKLDSACRALRLVHTLLTSKSTLTDMRELFSDALKFISKFYPIIQRSALHTYHSALSFMPTETLLYKQYHQETIDNVCQVRGVPENWDHFVTHPIHGEEVKQVIFSPDSSMFASLSAEYAKVWDTITGAPIGTIIGNIMAIADDFSTAASYRNHTITLYDVSSCTFITTFNTAPASLIKLAISPDGRRLAAGLSDGTVCLWNSRRVDPVVRLDQFAWEMSDWSRFRLDKEEYYCCLTFNPSGDRLAFGTDDGIVLLHGVSGEFVAEMKRNKTKQYLRCVAFSGNGSRIAFSDECQLSLCDSKNGALLHSTELKEPSHAIAISDDGTLIAVDQDKRITLWSLDSKNSLAIVGSIDGGADKYGRYGVSSMTFHRDSLLAIILSMRFWDVSGSFPCVVLYDVKNHSIIPLEEGCMAISPDDTWTVKAHSDGILQLLNVEIAPSQSIKGREGRNDVKDIAGLVASWSCQSEVSFRTPVRLDFSPDCLRLASCYDDGTVDLWDTSYAKQLIVTLKPSEWIKLCAFSADGSYLATGLSGGTITLWNGRSGAFIDSFKLKYPQVTSIVFLRGLLAVRSQAYSGSESDITLWSLKKLRRITIVTTDSSKLSELFHHDTMLIYYKERKLSEVIDVTIWDTERRAPHATIPMDPFPKSIERMVMSPDKSKLVVRLEDGDVKCLNLLNGYEEVMSTSSRHEDLDWLPPTCLWDGIPVWLHRSNEYDGYCVSGRISEDGALIPVFWIHDPANSYVRCVVRGSSMFALVYRSQHSTRPHIIVLRSSQPGQSIDPSSLLLPRASSRSKLPFTFCSSVIQ